MSERSAERHKYVDLNIHRLVCIHDAIEKLIEAWKIQHDIIELEERGVHA